MVGLLDREAIAVPVIEDLTLRSGLLFCRCARGGKKGQLVSDGADLQTGVGGG